MKELIEKELEQFKDTNGAQEGIPDKNFDKIFKMISDEISVEAFSIVMHHYLKLKNKIGLEIYWQTEQWWNQVSDFAADHISDTIDFVRKECSADEFSTLSEIFDEITQKSKSKEFIEVLREAARKFPEECEKHYIIGAIDDAEGYL